MNDMENVTLQNGEIAFLQSGTVIMNVDTAIELSDKLEARQKNTGEQSAEEAMENVMLLLALLFGPEILDKKPITSKLQQPVAPAKPVRDPADDTHPAPGYKFYFPLPLIGNSESAKRAFTEGPFVYVDNYGNVLGTMSECDYLHQMAPGTTQKLVSGKQHLGYAMGYKNCSFFANEDEMKLVNLSIYGPHAPKHQVRTLFSDKHLVTVVAVHKSEIVASEVNTRASRYAAWKNAMAQANKILNNLVEDPSICERLIKANLDRPIFSRLIDLCRQEIWKYRKEYESKNQKFPYDD